MLRSNMPLLAGAFLLFSAGCTTTEQTETAKANSEQAQNVKVVGKTGTTRNTNEAGEEIICRRDNETGSRVKFTEVCGTEAEWEIMQEANRKQMNDMTGSRAHSNE